MQIKLFIVEDFTIILESFKIIFSNSSEYLITGISKNGLDVIDKISDTKPDVIIMDISLPEISGIDITAAVKNKFADIKVIAFTMSDDLNSIKKALDTGADGYVVKTDSFDELLTAINTVLEGNTYISKSMLKLVVDDYLNKSDDYRSKLNLENNIDLIKLAIKNKIISIS